MTHNEWREQLAEADRLLPHMTSDERAEYKSALRCEHGALLTLRNQQLALINAKDTEPELREILGAWMKDQNQILKTQEKQLALMSKWDRRDKEERVQLT